MSKEQVYIAKGSSPWYSKYYYCKYNSHVINIDESISGQATVTYDDTIVYSMNGMFYNCHGLTSLDLSSFDTSKVTDMNSMFNDCSNLTSLDLSSFDTSNVTDMNNMFAYCTDLTTLDLSSFDTSKVEDMSLMFYNCSNLVTIKGVIDMKSCEYCENMFYNCPKLKGVKIKNPPPVFESWSGLSKSQYTIVDDESDSLERRNNMFRTTGIEPIDCIDVPIIHIPLSMQNDAPKYDKAAQEFDGEKEKDNKAVKELSNKLNEIVGKNIEVSSPKEEKVSKETKAEDHKPTKEEKVQKAIDDEEKIYIILKNFIYESDFIPAFLWFMEHAYNNVSFAHQHKRRVYKIYKEIIKGGNLFGKCMGDNFDEQGNCIFFMNGSDRALKDYRYNRRAKVAKLLAKFIIASNTTPYVLDLISYYEDSDMDCYTAIPTAVSDIRMVHKSELYVKTLEKVCFGRNF